MQRILTAGAFALALVSTSIGLALAQGTVTNTPPSGISVTPNPPPLLTTPPSSVVIVRQPPPPPGVPIVPCTNGGLGTPNPFSSALNPGSADFRPGVCNPLNNPHPMLPWGDGQIGGERYGQVIRYWENQPQVVYNVIFVTPPAEEAAPPPTEPEPQPQGEPSSQPSTPQGALDAKAARPPEGRSVTVPAYWIVETTRGYLHMPRWALQEVGGGRYQWVLVGAWFHPR
jgi:hypothetical protein